MAAQLRLIAGHRFILTRILRLAPLLCAMGAMAGQATLQRPSDLFKLTNVWTVQLKFTPQQWEAIEPAGGDGEFRGPGGPRGPGRFDAAILLAPIFLQQGDQNHDGKLSDSEFRALGERWFSEWDKETRGKLNADQVRDGFSSTLPSFGPPGFGGAAGRRRGGNLQGAEGKRNGLASASGIEFNYVHADLEFDGQLFKDVAVRYKGNGTFMNSRGSLKRSFKVELNKYVKGQKLAGISKLNLHNNVTDASWMNEVLSHRLFRDAGVPAPRTSYARVYVTVPGMFNKEYFGLYSVVEDIDRSFLEANFATRKGTIFKPVTPNLFADLGDDWKRYNQAYDPKTELSDKEKSRVIEFARLVTSASDADFAAQLGEYLDLEEFARFMAVTVWLSTMDSILGMGQNFYVCLNPAARRFQFLPWDLDHSFGQFPMAGSQEQRENLSIRHPWRGENRFLERVFQVEAFQKLYLAKMSDFSKSIFKPERFQKQVDEIAAAIRTAVQDESGEKLARFDTVVAGAAVERAGFGGRGGFGQPAKPIKGFVKARAQSVLDQLAGKSEGEVLDQFGFGGRGGRGGRDGGPGGFGPGNFLAQAFMSALDANQDEEITRDEFTRGFARLFKAWNTDQTGLLTDHQLRTGLNADFAPVRGGLGFGPPPP